MSVFVLIVTCTIAYLLMVGVTEFPFSLLQFLHPPQWLSLLGAFLLLSWMMGE